jgi:hypothetical protein
MQLMNYAAISTVNWVMFINKSNQQQHKYFYKKHPTRGTKQHNNTLASAGQQPSTKDGMFYFK